MNPVHSPQKTLRQLLLSPSKVLRKVLLFVLFIAVCGTRLHAQSAGATAVQDLGISAFGAGTGNWTNLSGGRNLALTAGGDLAFLSFRRFRPVLEIRGTYPFYEGHVDRQKSAMGGVKIERQFGKFHPYINFLVGRGVIDFENGGYLNSGYLYIRTVSTVYSPGVGLDYDISRHWSAKADFQYQHWDTPAVTSGVVNPRLISAGAIYRFDFNHYYKARRHTYVP